MEQSLSSRLDEIKKEVEKIKTKDECIDRLSKLWKEECFHYNNCACIQKNPRCEYSIRIELEREYIDKQYDKLKNK